MAGILVVCMANVCRSPLAEIALLRGFDGVEGFEGLRVTSAGVGARESRGICRAVAQRVAGTAWEAHADQHRARALEPSAVREADLVLTASREVRAAVVAAVPERRRRIVTLREAVWLGTGFARAPGLRGSAAVEAFQQHIDGLRGMRAAPTAQRSRWFSTPDDPLDIVDGHTMGRRAHAATLQATEQAAASIAALVVGAAGD
ncbi:hypothetical protein AA0Z99_03105 [Agrococcus sp. 1P02AA]|uniref:arsenate reductase/protein-tyrosine-phosphatase family protein n=1 Tax=Agrococcus sp. 1P02AA TaxID=3132259 RepID=UPI0039A43603